MKGRTRRGRAAGGVGRGGQGVSSGNIALSGSGVLESFELSLVVPGVLGTSSQLSHVSWKI